MKRQKKLIWIWNENVNNLHYLSRRFIGSVHLNHIQIEWHVDCGWNFGLFASVQPNCLTACGRAPNCKTVQRTGTDNLSTLLLSNACSGRPPLTAHTSVIWKLMVSAIATFQCRFFRVNYQAIVRHRRAKGYSQLQVSCSNDVSGS